jgi:hypothetical protein
VADNQEISVKITADVKALIQGMKDAQEHTETAVAGMKGDLGSMIESFEKFGIASLAIGAAGLAFEALKESIDFVKDAVRETLELSESFHKLSYETGISYEELNGMSAAAKMSGNNIAELEGWVRGATRALKSNEEQIRANGIATRDASGNLLPFQDYLKNVMKAADGMSTAMDRNQLLMLALGRAGVQAGPDMERFLSNLEAGKSAAAAYGLEVGESNVLAMEEFQHAMGGIDTGMTALKTRIGAEIIPTLTELAQEFGDILPAAVRKVEDSARGLRLILIETGAVFKVAGLEAGASFRVIENAGVAGFAALKAAASGHFTEAMSIIKNNAIAAKDEWLALNDSIQLTKAQMDLAEAKVMSPDKGEGGAGPKGGGKFNGKGAGDGQMKEWKDQLAQMRAAVEAAYQGTESMSNSEELSFWRSKVSLAKKGTAEYAQVWDEITKLIGKETAEKEKAEAEQAKTTAKYAAQDAALAHVVAVDQIATQKAILEEKGRALDQDLAYGRINEAQWVAMKKAGIAQELRAQLDALDAEQKAAKDDLVAWTKIQNQKDALTRKAHLDMGKIEADALDKSRARWTSFFSSMTGGFDSAIQGLVKGTMTWGNAFKAVTDQALSGIISFFVRWGIEEATRWATSLAMNKTGNVDEAQSAAALYAVNAMASVAEIPMVGWAMAPGVGEAAYAEGLAMAGLASAEGGWDRVPQDTLAMIHKNEMVLPANLAESVRSMASGGDQGGERRSVSITIHAMDGQDVHRVLTKHQDSLFRIFREGGRNGRI